MDGTSLETNPNNNNANDVTSSTIPSEQDALLKSHRRTKTEPSVNPSSTYRSMPFFPTGGDSYGLHRRSISISGDGSLSYLTPLQLGRKDLYEVLPFTAVFGLQRKEREIERAYASYAADLDLLQAEQAAEAAQHPMSDLQKAHRKSYSELLLLDEFKIERVMMTTPLIAAVIVASLSQFIVGYNIGVMNSPSKVVFPGHTVTLWSLAVASFAIGGPFGAAMAGKLADTRGRRGALLINVWAFLFGGLLQTFSIDMYSIIIARFLIGFASGTSSVLVPIYLGELAPPALRGFFGTLTQFALVTGILVSDLLSFILATSRLWRYLFSITSIGAVVQLLLAPFLLESPRWLLSRDPNSKRARGIIKKLRGMRYDYEVSTEAMHYIAACRAQDVRNPNANNCEGGGGGAFTEMFRNQDVRLLLLCCLGLQMAQQLCGINAVFYYSTDFFEGIIHNPLVGTTLVGAVNVIATYAAMLLMDSWGRRTLILISSGGMFLSCGIIVLALLGILNNLYALFAVNLYVTFFELGLGPIPFLLVAEMFDAKYVATAMSACIQLNWACNFIIGLVFPFMNQYLGPYSFAPFALILLITFVATYIYLPETRGTTPEELQEMIKEKNKETEFHNFNIIQTPGTPMDIEWKAAMERIRFEEEEGMKLGSYNYGFTFIDTD